MAATQVGISVKPVRFSRDSGPLIRPRGAIPAPAATAMGGPQSTARPAGSADISQITSRFAEIIPPYHRRGNCIPFAAIRWSDFGDQPSVGRPFGQICRHSDIPLLSFSPGRRFPRPTPGRVLVADHQSGSGFSGTSFSARHGHPMVAVLRCSKFVGTRTSVQGQNLPFKVEN